MDSVWMSASMVPVTVGAFALCSLLCMVGVFSDAFRDNWLQHLGMVALGIASALKIPQVLERGIVSHETALLALGTGLFAMGMAWKVWQHRHGSASRGRLAGRPRAKRRTHTG